MKDYLTVKEFAEMANKKQQTIYKQLDKRLKPFVKIENGQKVISAEALEKFYKTEAVEQLIQPNSTENQPNSTQIQLDPTATQPNSTAGEQPNPTAGDENEAKQEDQIAALNKLIEIVQKQLEEKDKQLAVKDKQIQDLSDRLAEALQLTKGQQYIAAADKTKELIAARGQQDQEEGAAAADQEETTSAAAEDQADQEELQPREKGFLAFLARLFKS